MLLRYNIALWLVKPDNVGFLRFGGYISPYVYLLASTPIIIIILNVV